MTISILARAALVLLLGLLAAGCGPGVGGTGTGNGSVPPGAAALEFFGAEPSNACATGFGELIACTATTAGESVQRAPVTLAGECAVATFEGNDVVLDVVCLGWTFSGRWGTAGDGSRGYFGLIAEDLLLPPTRPALLEVQVQGQTLVLWLRAADGRLLAGPLVLARLHLG
ncbi:MAG: hypothetical protein Fur0014_03630 [Rubrivivax sp.]